ncbi:MAG: glycosyltransferase family 39 protein [Aeromicrobium erythreum]
MDQTITSRTASPAVLDRPRDETRTSAAREDSGASTPTTRRARFWRGRPDDHPAVRPALLALLAATALLYLWGLGASGWANSFYSAAVQAGSVSWKAFFFGSSDAGNAITVDKTPASLWVMALSVRVFGLSSWSILVPQALMGVGTVGLLHHVVRRSTGNGWAGLAAGAVLATTPVATLMFRFNNPDALLVLLLVGSVAATLRALDRPDRAVRWLALGGGLVGLAFLTKMLQAFLVLPALAGVYLLAASVPLARRLGHLLVAFASMVVAGGWWVAVVELWPASSRPYVGGSQTNSVLELTLGYNGLGRLNGDETGSVGGGGGGGGWGSTGLGRLLGSEIGGQVAWLLPAALVLGAAGLWFARRAGRRDRVIAGLVVWGLWTLVTGLTFSLMAGIFHAYYTVALAPGIAALVSIGGLVLWQHRAEPPALLVAAFTVAATAALAFVLLGRTPTFLPWLRWVVLVVGIGAAVVVVLHRLLPRRFALAVTAAGVVALLAGPTAFAVETAATPHTGSIPSAGPSGQGGPGGRGGFGGMPQPPAGATQNGPTQNSPIQNGAAPGGTGRGGAGGLLSGSRSSSAIDALLREDASSYRWVAAATGSNNASGYQLSTQLPVMALGGFNGSDPSPTLDQFKQLVADGDVHWYIAGGSGGRGGPGGGTTSAIQSWVEASFTARTVDGVTLYDLSTGATS